MTERARSFGAVAAAYERFRPGYPDAVADVVLEYAGPVATALEIGAGTGKLTRLLAARGIAVTATDPDPAMLAELRRHVPGSVTPVRAAFEELAPGASYDLVVAAASLHWTDPVGRWERVAGLLGPSGVVASLGGPPRLADPAVEDAVRRARADVLPDDEIPSPDGTPPEDALQWPGTELVASPLFADVHQVVVEQTLAVSADDHLGYLGTVSAYLQLPAGVRAGVLDRIRAVLPDVVEVRADVTVHLARRSTASAGWPDRAIPDAPSPH